MNQASKETRNASQNAKDQPKTFEGWLVQCPPGLAGVLKKEMVFRGALDRKQDVYTKRQRNHDLIFASRVKSSVGLPDLRVAEMVLRCPVYGRFKISKNQLNQMADALKAAGPRRLVVSVTGRHFQRHDLARFLERELNARGYEFDHEIEDEVWMFCIDETYYFGLPASKARATSGREEREDERKGSLPPPIAAAMVFAGMPKPDDVVLDPVCGSGTLLSECHAYAPEARLSGIDIDPRAVEIARSNLKSMGAEIEHGDSRKTGRPAESVSLVLANLPFGVQFGSKETNADLYRGIFTEMIRVANRDTFRMIALTSDVDSFREAVRDLRGLRAEEMFKVKIRGELAVAYRLKLV